jgi:hypothetical protein
MTSGTLRNILIVGAAIAAVSVAACKKPEANTADNTAATADANAAMASNAMASNTAAVATNSAANDASATAPADANAMKK